MAELKGLELVVAAWPVCKWIEGSWCYVKDSYINSGWCDAVGAKRCRSGAV